jgi:hypothetical protein
VSAATQPDDGGPPERSLLLPGLAILGAISVVLAALVIFSSGGSPTRPEEPEANLRAADHALLMGRADAPRKVVVFEDFGGAPSRAFEIASRDFLRDEAARGEVLVEYRPFHLTEGYSSQALIAWAAVLREGSAGQAKRLHDVIFDRQPSTSERGEAGTELEAWAVEAGVAPGVVADALERPDEAYLKAARQAARSAGVTTAPTVLLDGEWLEGSDAIGLAERLQRALLQP